MVRQPNLKKGTWTRDEDEKLFAYIMRYGIWNWNQMPKFAGLQRSGKSCRLRWMNYLKPNIRRGKFTREEEETIIKLQKMLGNRWSAIAARLPQRTDNDIKNYWNTRLKKRVMLEHNKDSGSATTETNSSIEFEPESENSCDADSFVSSENNSSAPSSISPTEVNSADDVNCTNFLNIPTILDDFPGQEPAPYTAFIPPGNQNYSMAMDHNLVSSEDDWEIESLWEQLLMTMEGFSCDAIAPNSQSWQHNQYHEHYYCYDPVDDFWVNPLI